MTQETQKVRGIYRASFIIFAALALVRPARVQAAFMDPYWSARVAALGGAFTAIADDASGVYYNPAGVAFALSNELQGSANAFPTKTTIYKDTIGDEPFTETSGGNFSPFFGILQKLDRR